MSELLKPLHIGSLVTENNLILSPMAGFSDLPFRALCRDEGAGLVCTEMVAAPAVLQDARPTLRRMRTQDRERPVSIQVFGREPEEVARATRRVEDHCQALGFNMGCPAHQIRKAGCGAALLDEPERAVELVRAVCDATRKPVIAKMRLGNSKRMDIVRFVRQLESVGAAAMIVHGRTAKDNYSGQADWRAIGQVKAAVGVPVIANGDVVDGPSAQRALEDSGADGLAIGRASLGDPGIFRTVRRHLTGEHGAHRPTVEDRLRLAGRYVEMAENTGIPLPQVRNHLQRFTKGLPGAPKVRQALYGAADHRAFLATLERLRPQT